METWDLDESDVRRLRRLLRFDLAGWDVDADGDFNLAIRGTVGKIEGSVTEGQERGADYIGVAFLHDLQQKVVEAQGERLETAASFVRQVDQLLHGDQADSMRTLFDLLPDIEHLVKRCWELQDRVVELERGTK